MYHYSVGLKNVLCYIKTSIASFDLFRFIIATIILVSGTIIIIIMSVRLSPIVQFYPNL